MANEEKRKSKRVAIVLEATWEGQTGSYEARVSDISRDGCYLDTISQAALGDLVHINVRLPDGNWLALSGVVVHRRQNLGFGITFTNLSEEQCQSINQHIDAATQE
jgi:hypothetical protein